MMKSKDGYILFFERGGRNQRREEDIPEEIRGLNESQLVERIKELNTTKTQLAELQTASQTKDTQISEIQTQLNETKQALQNLQDERAKDGRRESQQNQHQQTEEITSVFDNEDEAIRQRVAKQTEGLQQVAFNSGALTAKMYATSQLQRYETSGNKEYKNAMRIFNKYEADIDKIVASYPPEVRANPLTWVNAFVYVRGLHMNDIMEAVTSNKAGEFFGETGGGTEPPPPDKKEDQVTPEEDRVFSKFERFGPKRDDILKARKGMVIGPPISSGQ
jgi:hypothetical protein